MSEKQEKIPPAGQVLYNLYIASILPLLLPIIKVFYIRSFAMKKNKSKKELEKQRKKMSSDFDVNGAYTGTPSFDKDDVPVQDADDL